MEEPAVVRVQVKRGVSLDVCPSSNVALQVVPSLEAHPLPALLAAGVQVSLNTDCPLFLGTTTVDEYAWAQSSFGLSPAALAGTAEPSLRTSSCPADRLAPALSGVEAWRSGSQA